MPCNERCVRPSHGTRNAHCSVCHKTFSGVRNFDRHRSRGVCITPVQLNLTERRGVWGYWDTLGERRWW